MASSAMEQFVTTPDLLYHLADHVDSQKAICRLCLVNKTFYNVFAPRLFGELWIDLAGLHPEQFERLQCNPHLRHVRTLEINGEFDPRDIVSGFLVPVTTLGQIDTHRASLHRKCERLGVLLALMPQLRSLRWTNGVMTRSIIQALQKSCTRLRSLKIYCNGYFSNYKSNQDMDLLGLATGPDFNGFRYLTSFALHCWGFYNSQMQDIIINVCKSAPGLSELSVSRENVDEADEEFLDYYLLERLCDSYGDTGGQQLRLKSLFLGTGYYMSKPLRDTTQGSGVADYLSQLTELASLERLTVWTGSSDLNYDGGRPIQREMSWDTLSAEVLLNLQGLSFFSFTNKLSDFLHSVMDRDWAAKLDLSIENVALWDPWEGGNEFKVMFELFNAVDNPVALRPRSLLLPAIREKEDGYIEKLGGVRALGFAEQHPWSSASTFRRFEKLQCLECLWLDLKEMPRSEATLRSIAQRFASACPRLRYIRLNTDRCVYPWVVHRADGAAQLDELDRWEDERTRPVAFDRRIETEEMWQVPRQFGPFFQGY